MVYADDILPLKHCLLPSLLLCRLGGELRRGHSGLVCYSASLLSGSALFGGGYDITRFLANLSPADVLSVSRIEAGWQLTWWTGDIPSVILSDKLCYTGWRAQM